ncbi:ATP-binding protein [Microvirga massiliensis]|uniref:ATP-binding protein n=1 Tax=Microvirga massiliensis TaxID=1033741 RepID=UPI00069C2835|nr:ATP-binding protein [Microvirga massiliensis]
MLDAIRRLFEADSLSPHGICLLWRPELIWTHAISDALIGTAYFSIPVALTYFVSKRPDVVFTWVFWAFATFILACGTTHYFSIWTLWFPDYGAEALIKVLTAAASVATAIALWPLLPKAVAVPSPAQLRAANAILEQRIRERDEALAALRRETAERLKAEEMLRHAQKMEALGHLTGGIAHDFNNLLTVVLGNLESIAKRTEGQGERLHRAVHNARTGAERAALLTKQLLAFGRKQPLHPIDLAVSEIVQKVAHLLDRTLGNHIALRTELAPNAWTAYVDQNELESALLNLAVNARDAMPKGGTLTIRTRNARASAGSAASGTGPSREFVLVEVTDTGEGMTEEVKSRAFEPFFTTKPVGQGSGLGLSQVHGFVTQSGGEVEIESELGEGATVRLYLPRAD